MSVNKEREWCLQLEGGVFGGGRGEELVGGLKCDDRVLGKEVRVMV